MTTADALDQGRESFGRQAWADAFDQLSAADREAPLAPEDLERLATATYLLGRDADSTDVWVRAHHEFLSRGNVERSARCAFWMAWVLLNKGDLVRGGGWVARARRLLDDGQYDCVEQGYLLWGSRHGPSSKATTRARAPISTRSPRSVIDSATGTW
jgi:hypothetical protein